MKQLRKAALPWLKEAMQQFATVTAGERSIKRLNHEKTPEGNTFSFKESNAHKIDEAILSY